MPVQLARDLLVLLAFLVLLFGALAWTLGTVRVVGHSMDPTLADGDLVLLDRVDYRLHSPARGDVVILHDPFDPAQDFVKRVVGVPGDHLLIRAGYLYVNGVRLDEPYVQKPWVLTTNWPAFPTAADGEAVPPGNYFVLGDNRDNSGDSRLFGYVTRHAIVGRAIARLLPLEHRGSLGR